VCVPKDGRVSPDDIAALGASWVRFTADKQFEQARYCRALKTAGIKRFITFDSDSFAPFGDKNDPSTWRVAAEWYANSLVGFVDAIGPGNEPDGTGPESWTATQAAINDMLGIFRDVWGNSVKIIAPGLVSGHAAWLAGIDLSLIDGIDVHLYGKRPPDWDHVNDPGTGRLDDALDEYRAVAPGKLIYMSEIGMRSIPRPDIQARYCREVMEYVRTIPDMPMCAWFAYHDHDNFGLVQNDGSKKPAWEAFRAVSADEEPTPPVPEPSYQLGFRDLADRLGAAVVGDPVELEHVGTIQKTTRGWMIYHPRTGEVAFGAKPEAPHETPVAGQQTALGDLWGAVVTVPFNVDAAIVKTWLDSPLAYGSPLGPERPIDGGGMEQAFTRALIRWTPADGVSVQTA